MASKSSGPDERLDLGFLTRALMHACVWMSGLQRVYRSTRWVRAFSHRWNEVSVLARRA